MVFSSIVFLIYFLPLLLLAYYSVPFRFKNIVLLSGSLFFYAWGESWFVLLMVFSILLNHLFGIYISKSNNKKRMLIVAVTINLVLLVAFKYSNFIVNNIVDFFAIINISIAPLKKVHLPIGISFFTFQAISYLVDIYRKEASVQLNPLNTALYISLFPQLIAGPIVRYHDVATQINNRNVDIEKFTSGLKRFIVGLAKKVLIANNTAIIADAVFKLSSTELTPLHAWLGIIAYSLQIYFDFSGYSDMAIGLGKMFGFDFLENFNYPYISKSIKEFWRRWHISLSSWFRDYLYIPLGGNRGKRGVYINLLIVFILCGFWHGAAWTFLIWGLWHGLFLIFERLGLGKVVDSLPRFFRHAYTLLIVIVGWVFFRADTLPNALNYLKAMFSFSSHTISNNFLAYTFNSEIEFYIFFGIIFSMPIGKKILGYIEQATTGIAVGGQKISLWIQGASAFSIMVFYVTILILSLFSLVSGTHNPFIYYRF